MARRRFEMHQYRQALVRMRQGDTDREIARANGHPEWEAEVRRTFAQRWLERAQPGWWVQQGAAWSRK